MAGRYLIYTPEINPDTFVFLFVRGTNGRSFSVRDYSYDPVRRLDSRDFPEEVTAETILGWARESGGHCIDGVDPHPVDDVDHWRALIGKANRLRLGKDLKVEGSAPEPDATDEWLFPMLDLEVFQAMPKARKTQDVVRMQSSPRSEDWVTWNVVRLLARRDPTIWWPMLLEVVNLQTVDSLSMAQPTRISPWVSVPSPVGYESASRARMANSDDPVRMARASHPDPVEGHSEIDVVIEGDDFLVYVEAKLFSDISLGTTHDPARNQIVRNIDCVVEHGGGRQPFFWMVVKDRAQDRLYVQVIDDLRRTPTVLAAQLPHHTPDDIHRLVSRIAVVTWTELLGVVEPEAGELEVWEELQRRVS